jgi:hypothetical protein
MAEGEKNKRGGKFQCWSPESQLGEILSEGAFLFSFICGFK